MRGVVTVAGLVTAGLLAVGWARSYGEADVLAVYGPGGRPVAVAVRQGVVYVAVANLALGPRRAWWAQHLRPTGEAFDELCDNEALNARWYHRRAGFMAASGRTLDDRTSAAVSLPAWLAVPVLLVPAARTAAVRVRRRRRRRRGRCVRCGYDRRGLSHVGSCPECGAAAGSR